MTTQLTLDLPARPALGRADFLVSPSNRDAVAWVDAWPEWPGRCLALAGPPSSGKSHLAAVWQARSAARRLPDGALQAQELPKELHGGGPILAEDIDRVMGAPQAKDAHEEGLLHLINVVQQQGGTLLLTGRLPPARLPVALPDLSSRLRAIQVAQLGEPDDDLLAALLAKHFADRQVQVTPQVILYLLHRIERSAATAQAVAERLDREALAQKRPISLSLVRDLLDEL